MTKTSPSSTPMYVVKQKFTTDNKKIMNRINNK